MTQLAGATIAARTTGKVSQYQAAGKATSDSILGYDSGTILGTVPPGKAGLKLVDGTIQNAADLTVAPDGNNKLFNYLEANRNGQNYATDPFTAAAGVSLAPQHE
jgi:hypothetical protein